MLEAVTESLNPHSVASFAIYMLCAAALLAMFSFIYTRITPHKEFQLIREGNTAAAVALGGTLIGFALPFNSIITHSVSVLDFAMWAVIAGIVQIMAYVLASLVLKELSARIKGNEIAAGLFVFFISISAGILNAACMTPA